MKGLRKKIAVLLCTAVTLGTAACNQAESAAEVLQKAQETMSGVTSMAAQTTLVQDMTYAGEEFQSETSIESVMIKDPLTMHVSMSMDDGTGLQEMDLYAEQVDGKNVVYMQVGGTWYAQSATIDDVENYNAENSLNFYLENLSEPVVSGTEKINDVDCVLIEGALTGEAMQEAAKDLQMTDAISEEAMQTIYDEIGSLPMRIWIDADGYVRQYEVDLTSMMQKLIETMMSLLSVEINEGDFVAHSVLVTAVCSQFNEVETIDIPDEARSTQVIEVPAATE